MPGLHDARGEQGVGQRIGRRYAAGNDGHQHDATEQRQPLEAVGMRAGQALHERRESVEFIGSKPLAASRPVATSD